MVAFYFILDTSRVNAQTMLALNEKKDPRKINSFEIGFDLVMSLVCPELECRPRFGLQKNIISKINLYVNQDDDDNNANNSRLFPKLGDKRKLCSACSDDIAGPACKQKRASLPRNKTQCQKCGVSFCPSHSTYVCAKHIS